MSQIEQKYKESGKETEFILWFNIQYIEDNNFTIKVSVPSSFMWNQMISRGIINILKEELKKITGQNIEIESVVEKKEIKTTEDNSQKIDNKIDIKTIDQKKDYQKSENHSKKNITTDKPFEDKFTFENFIVGDGSSSKFAYNVSYSVAENPGTKRNPVLLYGGVGLGKTHLMKAIGNKIHELFPEKKICYIQSESFLNEFTKSILNKTQDSFKTKYRKLDVLLLDDIHFLQNKPGIQDELFYTFEALKDKKAQMVFTCDRPLKEIEHMTERLVSRLGSGICLNLDFPSYEIRKAIIYKKLENENKQLPEEIIDYIAKIIETNIRDLEAALTNITGYAEFFDSPITLEIAQQQLQDFS